jgi:hypothetical protein
MAEMDSNGGRAPDWDRWLGILSDEGSARARREDAILLADFVNTTGEPLFDGALKQALAVQLQQSPFLNIFPQERVRQTLGYMSRSADERVVGPVAREICQRNGIKAVIRTELGNQYVLNLTAANCLTGDTLAQEQAQAASKEQVLSALGEAAKNMRKRVWCFHAHSRSEGLRAPAARFDLGGVRIDALSIGSSITPVILTSDEIVSDRS